MLTWNALISLSPFYCIEIIILLNLVVFYVICMQTKIKHSAILVWCKHFILNTLIIYFCKIYFNWTYLFLLCAFMHFKALVIWHKLILRSKLLMILIIHFYLNLYLFYSKHLKDSAQWFQVCNFHYYSKIFIYMILYFSILNILDTFYFDYYLVTFIGTYFWLTNVVLLSIISYFLDVYLMFYFYAGTYVGTSFLFCLAFNLLMH